MKTELTGDVICGKSSQAVCHLSVNAIVIGSLPSRATVNFPPRPVCYDPHSVVMVSGSAVEEARVDRQSDNHIDLHPCGSFLKKFVLYLTRMTHIHSSLFLCSPPGEPFIEILYIFVTVLQNCQVYYSINKSNVPSGMKNIAVKVQHCVLNLPLTNFKSYILITKAL